MDNQFDYEKEKQKFEKEKLEWKNFLKNQESLLERESDILIQFQESLLTNNFYNNEKNSKDSNNLSDLESIKALFYDKLKNLICQLNSIKEEQELFYRYKDKTKNLLEQQLNDFDYEIKEYNNKKDDAFKKFENLKEKEKELVLISHNILFFIKY